MHKFVTIAELEGKTLSLVECGDEEIVFTCASGERYRMYHEQDCCESVDITEVVGDLASLVGSPILVANEVIGHEGPKNKYDSVTLTDFVLGTKDSTVTIKWLGASNGYYSEEVYIAQID